MEPGTIDWWMRIFEHERPSILIDAIRMVSKECERMPTPGHLTKAIERLKEEGASGQPEEPRECELCGGTGYRLYETQNGLVAIACRCVAPQTKERIEAELEKPAYYSAKRFAKEERRRATPVKREPIADQKLYRAEDCPEGREFLEALRKYKAKGKS